MKNTSLIWLLIGAVGACLLPWYVTEDGFWSFTWLASSSESVYPSALMLILKQSHWWLIPPLLAIFCAMAAIVLPLSRMAFSYSRLGAGALTLMAAFLYLLTTGIAGLKKAKADVFVIGLIGTIVALVAVFVFFPIAHVLITAFETVDGGYGASRFFGRYFSWEIWGLDCLIGGGGCGPAINSVFLAFMTATGAFLVMIGVVEGVSPSMEEASQTMRATKWQTFSRVSLPLMRPGLANAFLLGFIESLADFGNPLVLGGDFTVLSTEIYFAIVGAVADTSRAAVLGMVLLTLTVSAFLLQRWWLGKKSYATVTGKADSGQHSGLNPGLKWTCYFIAIPWAVFTAIVYCMIVYGSLVKLWGYDNSFTFQHYLDAFAIKTAGGFQLVGSAWDSYITTLQIASLAAPLTALLGLLTAYVLVRQQFAGKDLFEFSTMLSFAIPGTVVGISYILAFNVPPIELTGTGVILIIAFIFRNMPVGVRGGIAAMSQLDKNLDEASITLGASSFTTLRRVVAPLLGPAILAALIYSFVRAITSVSAVIFLVSAEHNMATSYIVGRVENGEFGIAIAYSTVLIFTMLGAILLLQVLVGKRKLRKDTRIQG